MFSGRMPTTNKATDGDMKLKTYRAASMAEALSKVKSELGKDAVILHTRTVKVGGVLGIGRKTAVEITAADEPTPTARRGSVQRAKSGPATGPARVPRTAGASAGGLSGSAGSGGDVAVTPAGPGDGGALPMFSPAAIQAYRSAAGVRPGATPATPAAPAPIESGARPSHSGAAPAPSRRAPEVPLEPVVMPVRERRVTESPAGPTPMRAAVAPDSDAAAIHRDLQDIKLLVNQVLHASPVTAIGVASGAMPDALFRHYLRLLEAAVSRDLADQIIGAVRDELTPGELQDEAIVRATVLRHLAGLIPVADVAPPGRSSSADQRAPGVRSPTVIALIGPTGVGKTTTIAKLAAAYKLRQGKSVALITSDTYRIAAVDQLRTYAGIIGLHLKVVLTPAEMAQAVQSLSAHDVILIDTAGRSQFNNDRLDELREFLAAASPSEVHLVLSTTAAESVLLKTAAAFAPLRPNRVILTKLDEAVNFGVIVNVVRRLSTHLSFVTTGQEVPDDIEPGRADRLARLVLDNGLGSHAAVPPRTVRNPSAQPVVAGA